ncbi:molybdate ABC transporter permease subunit [Patulibacter americanus]|uniref:molybdate ABC transporter permease subunit n=1 Tax=Patulibacter americanus TaxID=588672 RepID=UPI0003B35BE6|nr:ABC transporter permease subunit [Patulibacter americanus]
MRGRRPSPFGAVTGAALLVVVLLLGLPVVAILTDTAPGRLWDGLTTESSLTALALSLAGAAIATVLVVVVGTPAAYLLATTRFRGSTVLSGLLELPLVLPPAVAGIGLLAAFGPQGLLGGALDDAGLRLPLTFAAVVVALVFVAGPFHLRQAQAAFGAVDPAVLDAARLSGARESGVFLRVAVPVAAPGLGAGATLTLARALGEFGATLMFAGSLQGVTRTASLEVYTRFGTDFPGALALSAVLVLVSALLLVVARLLATRGEVAGAAG